MYLCFPFKYLKVQHEHPLCFVRDHWLEETMKQGNRDLTWMQPSTATSLPMDLNCKGTWGTVGFGILHGRPMIRKDTYPQPALQTSSTPFSIVSFSPHHHLLKHAHPYTACPLMPPPAHSNAEDAVCLCDTKSLTRPFEFNISTRRCKMIRSNSTPA